MPNLNYCFLLLMLIASLSTSAWAKPQHGDRFGDWMIQCAEPKDDKKNICHISQNLTYKQDGKQLLNMAIGALANTGKDVLIVTLRLGIFLPSGVQVQVDSGDPKAYPIQWCLANGCHAYIELTTELLAMLKKGNQGKITFQDASRKNITVPVSLKGFTKAYYSMKQLAN